MPPTHRYFILFYEVRLYAEGGGGGCLPVFGKFIWRSCIGAGCSLGRFWWHVIFLLLSNLEHKNDSHRLLRKWLLHVAPSKAGATLEFKTNACHSHHWSHYHQEWVLGLGCWNGGLALICGCGWGAGFERRGFHAAAALRSCK
jgi:hypothetical protein